MADAPASTPRKKYYWPELLGELATPAVQVISHDRPDVAVQVLPPGYVFVPDGFNSKRVRVWVNTEGRVTLPPPYVG